MLTNYFSRLSREEKEQIALRNHQEGRIRNETRAAIEEKNDIERNRIASQVIEIIDSDDSRDVGNQVRDTFQAIMTNEVIVVVDTIKNVDQSKRKYGRRPDNWKEITLDFMTYKNQSKTMNKFGLSIKSDNEANREKNYNYWKTTLNKWKKQIHYDDGGLDSDLSDSESSESDKDEPEEEVAAPTKRIRLSNTMLGSVRGGKYSKRK